MKKTGKIVIAAVIAVILISAVAVCITLALHKKNTETEPVTQPKTTSAYNTAKENGYEGSVEDWISSLVEDDKSVVKAAYSVAVENGFEGTATEWVYSLRGDGADASVGISDAFINEEQHLIVTFDDGVTVDSGYTGTSDDSATVFTVVFKDYDGTVLKTQSVRQGENAVAPEAPEREGYTFTGWDNDYSNVQSNISVTAQYAPNSDEPIIIVENITASEGDKVTVNAVIKNNPGILGTSIVVNYDENALTLVDAEAGDAISSLTLTKPAKFKDGCIFPAYAETIGESDIKDGTILILTFKISRSAQSGSYLVKVSCPDGDTYDSANNAIIVTASPGSITVA